MPFLTFVTKYKQAHAFLFCIALLDDPRCSSKLLSFLAVSPFDNLDYAHIVFA